MNASLRGVLLEDAPYYGNESAAVDFAPGLVDIDSSGAIYILETQRIPWQLVRTQDGRPRTRKLPVCFARDNIVSDLLCGAPGVVYYCQGDGLVICKWGRPIVCVGLPLKAPRIGMFLDALGEHIYLCDNTTMWKVSMTIVDVPHMPDDLLVDQIHIFDTRILSRSSTDSKSHETASSWHASHVTGFAWKLPPKMELRGITSDGRFVAFDNDKHVCFLHTDGQVQCQMFFNEPVSFLAVEATDSVLFWMNKIHEGWVVARVSGESDKVLAQALFRAGVGHNFKKVLLSANNTLALVSTEGNRVTFFEPSCANKVI